MFTKCCLYSFIVAYFRGRPGGVVRADSLSHRVTGFETASQHLRENACFDLSLVQTLLMCEYFDKNLSSVSSFHLHPYCRRQLYPEFGCTFMGGTSYRSVLQSEA